MPRQMTAQDYEKQREYIASNPHGVTVGQVWRDRDYRNNPPFRDPARHVKVLKIEGLYARCQPCTPEGQVHQGNSFTIRLDRFRPNSTGFELVSKNGEN